MQSTITEKLRSIETTENIKILLAVESGSRAWGFASPDSDYDVRFVYRRNESDYLKLNPVRDVIEWQLDETLDISGWDLQKALRLLYRSNPTFFEWCSSPIIYHEADSFGQVREILPQYFSPKKSLYHYWHMAKANYHKLDQKQQVNVKSYFYILRPILAGNWIIEQKVNPPMLFDELVASQLPTEYISLVESLVEKKRNLAESRLVSRISPLDDYIEKSLLSLEENAKSLPEQKSSWETLEDLFLNLVLNS